MKTAESNTTDREAEFWNEHVVPLDECLAVYKAGPDRATRALLDSLEPLEGARVLDFACGSGIVSAWLAARGAAVVGLDVSGASIDRARELSDALGFASEFVVGAVSADVPAGAFDRVCGRFALHHTDVRETAPALAAKLLPGGIAAFLETMATNPLLRFARRFTGRFGIPRYGSLDEHPLTRRDLDLLRRTFGELQAFAAEILFFRMIDRQLLKFRFRRLTTPLAALDRAIGACGLDSLSYQQVLVLRRVEVSRR
jgi:SAM-dependent methyltransferase